MSERHHGPNTSLDMFEDLSQAQDQMEHESSSTWYGTPLKNLKNNFTSTNSLLIHPPLKLSCDHIILFKLPVQPGVSPEPFFSRNNDTWDGDHVRMPSSSKSLFPVSEDELKPRWDLVRSALSQQIFTSKELENAIFKYNCKSNQRWSFDALHKFFSETLDPGESEYYFEVVLPSIIQLVVSLPQLIKCSIPLLKKHCTKSISLSQKQISSLMANAFLCTFPRRNNTTQYNPYPTINFTRLFQCGDLQSVQEKLKCFVNYFRRICFKAPTGVVTYTRYYIPPGDCPKWEELTCTFPNLYISSEGTIEEDGTGMLEIDFANKLVGGGVLGRGSVQEEIKFLICPELIIARLLTESLDDTEALIVSGCERYNLYTGYGDTFTWAGDFKDDSPSDKYGRKCTTVVAIDATLYSDTKSQFTINAMRRELNKAFVGFSYGSKQGWRMSVATGNWGCGAFRGDPQLKALLQLLASAATDRPLAYFTFQNPSLRDKVFKLHSFFQSSRCTVGEVWRVLKGYLNSDSFKNNVDLYDYLYTTLNANMRNGKDEVEPTKDKFKTSPEDSCSMEVTCSQDMFSDSSQLLDIDSPPPTLTSPQPIPAPSFRMNTEEGRKRAVLSEHQRWQAYQSAKQELIPSKPNNSSCVSTPTTSSSTLSPQQPKTAVKRKISDYFTKLDDSNQ